MEIILASPDKAALLLTSTSVTHLCFLFPVGPQFQMASLGGAMAAVLGIVCLMITGVAVRARQVGEDSLSQSHHITPILAPLVTSAILLVAILGIT